MDPGAATAARPPSRIGEHDDLRVACQRRTTLRWILTRAIHSEEWLHFADALEKRASQTA
jgi:hypothetical protein